jgi:hypothetical protein
MTRTYRLALCLPLLVVLALVALCLQMTRSDAATSAVSVASGNWSNPAVWNTGVVPGATDTVTIASGHSVTYDVTSSQVSGVTVTPGATLTFDPAASRTLKTTANVVVQGRLVMHPASATVQQLLQFVNVDESKFTGQTMTPDMVTATDVGLWTEGHGQLDLVGTQKTGWTRAAGTVASGATSVTVSPVPVGWVVGDEVSIAPTQAPTVGAASYTGFDTTTISAISGGTVTLAAPTARQHPQVNGQWNAEVMDLTRNVRIEGTAGGRAHVMNMGDRPQIIDYVGIRYMGPESTDPATGRKNGFLSRYGLHFHFMGDGSRGSMVVGTVVRDTGNHAYVPHASHGITFRDDIAFNTTSDAYWWNDTPNGSAPESHDILWDHDMAASIHPFTAGQAVRLSGFALMAGVHNTIRDSVATGVDGSTQASGFMWPESPAQQGHGIWIFDQGNVAHNNDQDGIFTWQNNHEPHVIANFVGYYNTQFGIDNGAYGNRFRYENSTLYGNGRAGIDVQAVGPNRFENITIDGAGISKYGVESHDHNSDGTAVTDGPISLYRNTFKNLTVSAVGFTKSGGKFKNGWVSLEYPTLVNVPTDFTFTADANPTDLGWTQTSATSAEQVTAGGRSAIAPYSVPIDVSPPQVDTSLDGGQQVSGTVSVPATVYDLSGTSKVELYLDGVLADTASAAPFTTSFAAPSGAGLHQVMLRAYDTTGHSNDSRYVTVSTGCAFYTCAPPPTDTVRPVIRIVQPDAGVPVTGTRSINAVVEDVGGTVVKVDFYVDGALKRTATAPAWIMPTWTTTNVPNGNHTLTAVATDSHGNVGSSTPVVVTVAN